MVSVPAKMRVPSPPVVAMFVPVVSAVSLSASPSGRLASLTTRLCSVWLSTSPTAASSGSAMGIGPPPWVKVLRKSDPGAPELSSASRSSQGGSLTGITVTVLKAASLLSVPSLAITMIARSPGVGFCEVLL
jgi:hypothetical protein